MRKAVWCGAALVLALPFLAMQVSAEVRWDRADFLLFGAMLICAVGTYELAARADYDRFYRAAVALALATAFGLLWLNAAAGIVGAEDNPANLMYVGVLAIGGAASVVARFRPPGMARAMALTALVQALVAGVVLVTEGGRGTFAGTVVLVALWLLSAGLFRRARASIGVAER